MNGLELFKATELYTNQYVVGFDIRMHNVTFPQKAQREEELLRVRAYGPDVKSHVFAKTFNDVAKVHTIYAAERQRSSENDRKSAATLETQTPDRDDRGVQRSALGGLHAFYHRGPIA